jgi:ferredoxin
VKVTVARQICGGHGECIVMAPEVFDFIGDDEAISVIEPSPPEALWARVQIAADCCPTQAILIDEAD